MCACVSARQVFFSIYFHAFTHTFCLLYFLILFCSFPVDGIINCRLPAVKKIGRKIWNCITHRSKHFMHLKAPSHHPTLASEFTVKFTKWWLASSNQHRHQHRYVKCKRPTLSCHVCALCVCSTRSSFIFFFVSFCFVRTALYIYSHLFLDEKKERKKEKKCSQLERERWAQNNEMKQWNYSQIYGNFIQNIK